MGLSNAASWCGWAVAVRPGGVVELVHEVGALCCDAPMIAALHHPTSYTNYTRLVSYTLYSFLPHQEVPSNMIQNSLCKARF